MGEEMDESCRQHDTGSELLQDNEDDVCLGDDVEAGGQDGQEDTERTGCQYDKEKTDAQMNIIVTRCCIAGYLALTSTYAMPRGCQSLDQEVT